LGRGAQRYNFSVNRIWIVGSSGQIGGALVRLLGERAVAPSLQQLDLSHPDRLADSLDRLEADSGLPAGIINAAAYTQVDRAESEEATADAINALAPGAIARWCRRRGIPFVHYSTDYVYSGHGSSPWREDDPTGPLSAYGRSKLRGDREVESSGVRYLILRTSWVYDADGKNFVNTMLSLGRSRDTLRVVADQVGAPSYAPHVARLTLDIFHKAILMDPFPSGVYHLAPEGETSWHGFAEEIFAIARRIGLELKVRRVDPIPTAEYPTPAVRPLNSRLDKAKLRTTFDVRLPTWQDGLSECMEQKALRRESARPLT
jgi:dTDP-4-dehydrorhamnose reductase